MTEKTDYELLHGDSDDFTELYKRYSEGIRAFMFLYKLVRNPSDLDDILQLVWIRVRTCKSKYNPEWSFSTWLSKAALSATLNFYRDQSRTLPAVTNQEFDDVLDHRQGRDPLVVEDIVKRVREEIEKLPEDARKAVEKVCYSNTRFAASQCPSDYKRARRLLKCPLRPLYNEIRIA
jgi:RNA polymerase sigma factor (sigma-70 family)